MALSTLPKALQRRSSRTSGIQTHPSICLTPAFEFLTNNAASHKTIIVRISVYRSFGVPEGNHFSGPWDQMFNDIKELSASLVAFVSTHDTETTVVNFSSAAQIMTQDQTVVS